MSVNHVLDPIWLEVPSQIEAELDRCLAGADDELQQDTSVIVFVRADGSAFGSDICARLLGLCWARERDNNEPGDDYNRRKAGICCRFKILCRMTLPSMALFL